MSAQLNNPIFSPNDPSGLSDSIKQLRQAVTAVASAGGWSPNLRYFTTSSGGQVLPSDCICLTIVALTLPYANSWQGPDWNTVRYDYKAGIIIVRTLGVGCDVGVQATDYLDGVLGNIVFVPADTNKVFFCNGINEWYTLI